MVFQHPAVLTTYLDFIIRFKEPANILISVCVGGRISAKNPECLQMIPAEISHCLRPSSFPPTSNNRARYEVKGPPMVSFRTLPVVSGATKRVC